MTADNDCPVDLGELHIRLDDYQYMQMVGNQQLGLVCHSSPVVTLSKSAVQAVLTSPVETPFSDDIESWCWHHPAPNSECLPLTHDELIVQAADISFNPENYLNLLEEQSAMLHTSAYVSPEVSRSCTPYGSPVQNASPNACIKSGSLSTSPEVPCLLAAHMEKQGSNQGRRGSVDSGSEKKEQKVPRHKRPSHIRAETKRRGKIQECFNQLTQLVPMVVDNDTRTVGGLSRKTKAVVLNQTADYCRRLCAENKSLQAEADTLRAEMQALTIDIKAYHSMLPPEGIDQKALQKSASIDEMFRNYLNARSLANWKFWIFGQIMRPLFASFSRAVSTASMEEFLRTVYLWVNEHLSLVSLRPVVFSALLEIGKNPAVVKENKILPNEIQTAVLADSGLVLPSNAATGSR